MVLRDDPLTLKVLDFGVAKQINPGAANAELTTVGELVGTPLYMAPEQIDHRLGYEVGTWTDVYAVGLLLYSMLASEHPFEAESLSGVLIKNLHREPAPLRSLAPVLPKPVAALVHRCLEKDPRRRPSGARELIAALHDAVEAGAAEVGSDDDPTCFYNAPAACNDDDEQTAVKFDVPVDSLADWQSAPAGEQVEPVLQATLLTTPTTPRQVARLPRPRRRSQAWIAWLALTLCALGLEVAVALALVLA